MLASHGSEMMQLMSKIASTDDAHNSVNKYLVHYVNPTIDLQGLDKNRRASKVNCVSKIDCTVNPSQGGGRKKNHTFFGPRPRPEIVNIAF